MAARKISLGEEIEAGAQRPIRLTQPHPDRYTIPRSFGGFTLKSATGLYVHHQTLPHPLSHPPPNPQNSKLTSPPSRLLSKNRGITLAGFGGVAGFFAIYLLEGVPRVRRDIFSKIPVIGEYWEGREPPASDNVSLPRAFRGLHGALGGGVWADCGCSRSEVERGVCYRGEGWVPGRWVGGSGRESRLEILGAESMRCVER